MQQLQQLYKIGTNQAFFFQEGRRFHNHISSSIRHSTWNELCLAIAPSGIPTIVFSSVYFMLITITVIIAIPIIVPFERWSFPDDKEKIVPLLQANGAVIVGLFFFLNLSFVNPLAPQSEVTYEDRKILEESQYVMRSLTSLCVIPFAFASILVAIWGNQPFWQHEESIQGLTNPNSITGIKLGTIFMITGFVWIIVTMVVLINIGAILEWIPDQA
jgi:branched-subunit amino acid transport protein